MEYPKILDHSSFLNALAVYKLWNKTLLYDVLKYYYI